MPEPGPVALFGAVDQPLPIRARGCAGRGAGRPRAVHTAAYVAAIAQFAPPAVAGSTLDTVVSAGSYRAALHAAGGAVELVDAAGRRRGADRVQRAPPARASRRAATARWASACSTTSPSRRSRPRRWPRAGDDRRLGRPPRQRDQRHLPWERRGAVRLDPPVAAVPGTGSGVGLGGGRGRGFTSTCRCLRAPATACSLARRHVVVPLARQLRAPARCSSPRATTPIGRIRWRTAR